MPAYNVMVVIFNKCWWRDRWMEWQGLVETEDFEVD